MRRIEERALVGPVPQKIIEIAEHDPFLSSLPTIEELVDVPGGMTHRIYRIRSAGEAYYLKLREDKFAQVPQIAIDPKDISLEHTALTLFGRISPDNFPKVLSFDAAKFYMVLSDAIPNGEKLETLFLNHRTTRTMLFNLGASLRRVHDLSGGFRTGIRPDDDSHRYEELLQHRFGYRHNVVLDELTEELRKTGNRQLVMADASPKNIGVNNDGQLFVFFDLETAHKGDTVFDFGYVLGHILLHTLANPQICLEAVESYLKGYGENTFDAKVVKRIALGIMLYRLKSVIPYPTGLTARENLELESKIESVLPVRLEDATWQDVIELLSHEQN